MNNGYIAVHRKIMNNPIFDNPSLFKMWMWCLLKATHTEHQQIVGLEVVDLKKGQFITGRFVGAKELKVNESTWYKHLKQLEKLSMISINSNNKYTLVSVVKWELYQVDKKESNNKITTKEQQNNTNNNVNKDNNKDYSDFVKILLPLYRGRKSKSIRDKKLPKILKEYSKEEILKAIQNYNSTLKVGQTDFILNESTFWNGRFVDFLDINFKENKITQTTRIGVKVNRDNLGEREEAW